MIAEFQESVMVTIERKVEVEGKDEPWDLLQVFIHKLNRYTENTSYINVMLAG